MSVYFIIQIYSIGFAMGYIAALVTGEHRLRNKGGYKKGVNDCRNCKHLKFISEYGIVCCTKLGNFPKIQMACAKYKRMGDAEGDS